MKRPEVYLREYCSRLTDDQVNMLVAKLANRQSGDVADVLNFMGSVKEIDKWFSSSGSAWDLYDMLDLAYSATKREYDKRFSSNKSMN